MNAMNESDTMIEVVDLHKRFKDLHVLKGVSTVVTAEHPVPGGFTQDGEPPRADGASSHP